MNRKYGVGLLVLCLTALSHFGIFYVRRPPPVCGTTCGVMWKATDPRPEKIPDPPLVNRYFFEKRYLMGLSYGLALGFTAYAAARTFGSPRPGVAGVLGGLTLTGFLATAGCFLVGCCGSPMLTVYLALFGSTMLGLKEFVVLGLTIVSVLAGFLWMERRQKGTGGACCDASCACHGASSSGSRPASPRGGVRASVSLEADRPFDGSAFVRRCLALLQSALRERGEEASRVRLLLTTAVGSLTASGDGPAGEPVLDGELTDLVSGGALVLDVRAGLAPGDLQAIVQSVLADAAGDQCRAEVRQLRALADAPQTANPAQA
jgi:hypothetical protein